MLTSVNVSAGGLNSASDHKHGTQTNVNVNADSSRDAHQIKYGIQILVIANAQLTSRALPSSTWTKKHASVSAEKSGSAQLVRSGTPELASVSAEIDAAHQVNGSTLGHVSANVSAWNIVHGIKSGMRMNASVSADGCKNADQDGSGIRSLADVIALSKNAVLTKFGIQELASVTAFSL